MVETVVRPFETGVVRPYRDLREWLDIVGEMGELQVVHGADWNLEIAAITDLVRMESERKPALHPAAHDQADTAF